MLDPRFFGNRSLYGDDISQLTAKHLLIVGLGGVGSWCAEFLARLGVSEFTLMDPDDICVGNINRQVLALDSTIGKMKAQVLQQRLLDINPKIKINIVEDFFNEKSVDSVFESSYDFVIDAMDNGKNKALLVQTCITQNIPMILSGGAGGKVDQSEVRIANFKRIYNDLLLRQVRRQLKRNCPEYWSGNYYLACVFSPEPVEKSVNQKGISCEGTGSSVIVTVGFALRICDYVVSYLTRKARISSD